MILVTSASGGLGTDVVTALVAAGHPVRAFVHSDRGLPSIFSKAAVIQGDFFDYRSVRAAMAGVQKVFHISPPHHVAEFSIGQAVIRAASAESIQNFVLLSAIHPGLDSLVSHRQKRMVEENLIESHLSYTILQPTMFMQNTPIPAVLQSGLLTVPYAVEMPMSFVDRTDVAAIAVKVLSDSHHARATYELVGTEPTSFAQVAAILSQASRKPIEARQIPMDVALSRFQRKTVEERFSAETFERMFTYYNRHGLTGSSNVLRWLLAREPVSFEAYFKKVIASYATAHNDTDARPHAD